MRKNLPDHAPSADVFRACGLCLPTDGVQRVIQKMRVDLGLQSLQLCPAFQPLLQFDGIIFFLELVAVLLLPIQHLIAAQEHLVVALCQQCDLVVAFVAELLPHILAIDQLPQGGREPMEHQQAHHPSYHDQCPALHKQQLQIGAGFLPCGVDACRHTMVHGVTDTLRATP